jgi:mannose-6-phosphate isomerase-like protein (cupin superfamily)
METEEAFLGMAVDSPNFEGLDRWAFQPRRVEKPWGYELIWAHTDLYVGKVLFVRAGQSLSLQFHNEKDESWFVQSGRAELELGEAGQGILNKEVITTGAAFHYVPGTVHRVTALEDTTILEVSTPHLDDVVRLEDRYGREGTNAP